MKYIDMNRRGFENTEVGFILLQDTPPKILKINKMSDEFHSD